MSDLQEHKKTDNSSGSFWDFLERTPRTIPILTAISILILVVMLQSILAPFIFACILATLTWPLREKLLKLTKGRAGLTSFLLIFGMIFLIAAPITGIFLLAISQAQEFLTSFKPEQIQNWVFLQGNRLDEITFARKLGITSQSLQEKLQGGVAEVASWSMNVAFSFGSNVLHTFVLAGITLMSLFYLYVSGDTFVMRVKNLVPLAESQVEGLLDVFRRTSKAIFKGNFVIGATQGLLTGLLFLFTGLPSPVFFGVIAAFASLIPAVGSGLVWVPACLYFAFSGDFTRAAVVVGVGMGIISTLDNVLRPTLVGRDAGMHDLMVFLTTIGGITYFGPVGVLFGPLVGAGVLAMIRLYEESQMDKAPEERPMA